VRRAGLPEEIAAAALFVASRECGYLTGPDLMVDGGLTITFRRGTPTFLLYEDHFA
jgi:NAD(P)-dependent dehydrogenase (short-subunit alcohol dehydrogenase family)